MKITILSSLLFLVLFVGGCASFLDAPQQVYGCYFGEALKEKCESIPVAEDERLTCVDIAANTHFELADCDHHIAKKSYSFFLAYRFCYRT